VGGDYRNPPVLRRRNRAAEVAAKAKDWLQAGCSLVWVVDPELCTVTVYCGGEIVVLTIADTLTGGDVLPGFAVPVDDLF
jgi:hypothetical protein